MKNIKAGTAEVITFRTTREDSQYGAPIKAISTGTSTGHVALKLTFDDQELFEKYIADNPNIPSSSKIAPFNIKPTNIKMGNKTTITDHTYYKTIYEVYLSFWPNGGWDFMSDSSKLQTYIHDCEQSGNFTPMEYNDKYLGYLHPLQKTVAPQLPFGRQYAASEILLPPTIILHSTRLGLAFGTQQAGSILPLPNTVVVEYAELFVKAYREWRAKIVDEQNANFIHNNAEDPIDRDIQARFARQTKIAKCRLKIAEKNLKDLMYPGQGLDHDEFISKLEPFVTFGLPERDSVTFDLFREAPTECSEAESNNGLQLEPILAYIKKIADNPKEYPYSLFTFNCANVIYNALWEGIKDTNNTRLKEQFVNTKYAMWLNTTLTPTMVIADAAEAKAATEETERQVVLRTQHGVELNRQSNLSFRRDYEDDELPTSRLGVMAELVNQATELTRY